MELNVGVGLRVTWEVYIRGLASVPIWGPGIPETLLKGRV